jgi:hypothetical protein
MAHLHRGRLPTKAVRYPRKRDRFDSAVRDEITCQTGLTPVSVRPTRKDFPEHPTRTILVTFTKRIYKRWTLFGTSRPARFIPSKSPRTSATPTGATTSGVTAPARLDANFAGSPPTSQMTVLYLSGAPTALDRTQPIRFYVKAGRNKVPSYSSSLLVIPYVSMSISESQNHRMVGPGK